MSEKFVCRECGRTTYRVSYEWRDKALYENLVKVGLCEECYHKGRGSDDLSHRPAAVY